MRRTIISIITIALTVIVTVAVLPSGADSTWTGMPKFHPVHRFVSPLTGDHFYTADTMEATFIWSEMAWAYQYEGIAFYAPLWCDRVWCD